MSYEPCDSDLVELFEYRVATALAGQTTQAQRAALRDLREYLLGAPLETQALRRLRAADRQWRGWQRQNAPASPQSAAGEPAEQFHPSALLEGAELSVPAERSELEVLRELRLALFTAAATYRARQQAEEWRRGKQGHTLRLALALARALQSHSARPALDWPYSEVSRSQRAAETLTWLTEHLSFPLASLPARLQRLHAVLRALLQTPLPAGALGVKAPKDEAYDQEQLERTLSKLLAYSAQGGLAMANSEAPQPLLLEATQRLSQFLDHLLPLSLGGYGPELPLLGGLLYGRAPAVRLAQPDEYSLSLAVSLMGGEQAQWRGTRLSWRRAEDIQGWNVSLQSGQQRHDLQLSSAPSSAEFPWQGGIMQVALRGDDLALEMWPSQHQEFIPPLREAHLAAALLEPEQYYLNLRLARAAAMALHTGEVSASKVSPESALTYLGAPAAELLHFVRQGVQTLLRAASGPPERFTRAFAQAQAAAGSSPETAQALLKLFVTPPEAYLVPSLSHYAALKLGGFEHAVLPLRGEALSVPVWGQALTLRPEGHHLLVTLPGLPEAILRDLLILPTPRGSVLAVRLGDRVAVGTQAKLPHPH